MDPASISNAQPTMPRATTVRKLATSREFAADDDSLPQMHHRTHFILPHHPPQVLGCKVGPHFVARACKYVFILTSVTPWYKPLLCGASYLKQYSIEYCPGKNIQDADPLSPLPLPHKVRVPVPGDLHLMREHLDTVSRKGNRTVDREGPCALTRPEVCEKGLAIEC